MKRKINFRIVTILMFCLPFIGIQAQDEDVMFQAFDWNVQNQPAGQTWYNVLSDVRNTINDAGIDVIWMPPPSNSAAPQGYLPRELNNLNSAYGTQNQLVSLINQYHSLGMKVISDIVINHRVGSNDAVTFTNPAWPTFYITADDEGRNFVNRPVEFSINGDFVPGFDLKADGSSGGFAAARDLDHNNPAVRAEIIKWMRFLRNDIGFDGWRYDFVHGYDPIYNKEYNDATNPYFAVGELLESSRVQTNNFVNRTQQSSSAFDFNTKVSLQNAIRDNNLSYLRDGQGRPSGMIGINPAKSVTFLDNHDTGFAQQCCGSNFVFPGGETNLRKGYAYILTHPGNPMVFWTHFFDNGSGVRNAIKELISARKRVRVFAGSSINIAEARNNLYAAYIDGKSGTIAMKLGSENWSPNGNQWTLRASGNDYAVWTNDGNPEPPVEPYTVNFFKPNDWGSDINTYVYDAGANTTLSGTNEWPGNNMTNISGTNWYSYTITPPSGVSAGNLRVIFNDGTNQTGDLSRNMDGWYRGNTWYNSCPSDCNGSSTSTDVTLNFRKPGDGWGNNTNMYLYNKSTNQRLSNTLDWPGMSMNNLSGTSWCRKTFTLPNEVSPNDVGVVFNNGGSGQQTVDLTRGTNGWFRVTGSQNGKRTGIWSNNCPNNCPSNRAMEQADNIDKENFTITEHSISFWPNPIKDKGTLHINTSENGILDVTVSNILGQTKTIYRKNTQAGHQTIQINGHAIREQGMYFYTIRLNGTKLKRLKVIKQ